MKNNYGNYVIQKALSLANPETKDELALKIQENVPFLSNKKLKANWNHIIDTLNAAATTRGQVDPEIQQ